MALAAAQLGIARASQPASQPRAWKLNFPFKEHTSVWFVLTKQYS
jgi:hypothetical protein